MKGIKTSIAAFLILLAGLGLVAALIFTDFELSKFTAAMASLGAFGAFIIGWLAKDEKQTKSK